MTGNAHACSWEHVEEDTMNYFSRYIRTKEEPMLTRGGRCYLHFKKRWRTTDLVRWHVRQIWKGAGKKNVRREGKRSYAVFSSSSELGVNWIVDGEFLNRWVRRIQRKDELAADVGAAGKYARNSPTEVALNVLHHVDTAPHWDNDVKVTVCDVVGQQINLSVKLRSISHCKNFDLYVWVQIRFELLTTNMENTASNWKTSPFIESRRMTFWLLLVSNWWLSSQVEMSNLYGRHVWSVWYRRVVHLGVPSKLVFFSWPALL